MKKYLKIIQLAFINKLDYRQELITSLFIGIFIFAGQAIFWRAVFQDTSVVNGFTFSQILTYYLIARIISTIIDSKLGFSLSNLIIYGEITNHLIKPIKLKSILLSEEIGRILIDIFLKTFVYLIIFFIIFGGLGIKITLVKAFSFFVSITFSFLLSFCLFFICGCVAFWTDNATSLNYTLRRCIFFLAGGLVPLQFFPEFFQRIIGSSPFRYLYDLPIRILTADLVITDILTGIILQLIWLVILWFVADLVFSLAIKANQSVGI